MEVKAKVLELGQLMQESKSNRADSYASNCGALSWSHDHLLECKCLGLRVVGQAAPA